MAEIRGHRGDEKREKEKEREKQNKRSRKPEAESKPLAKPEFLHPGLSFASYRLLTLIQIIKPQFFHL